MFAPTSARVMRFPRWTRAVSVATPRAATAVVSVPVEALTAAANAAAVSVTVDPSSNVRSSAEEYPL